jgi:hypothetical protein
MLFVAEYGFGWDDLETVVAKRLEWEEVLPDGFRFVGEYVWPSDDPPFRGVAIIDADSVEALNDFILHYGPSLRMSAHPASDVTSGIAHLQERTARPRRKRRR